MKNLMKTLVTLSATAALLAASPAFARGGGGGSGGHGGGGHSFFAGSSSHSAMSFVSHDRSPALRSATHAPSTKSVASKEKHRDDRTHRQPNSESKVVREHHARKVEPKKVESTKLKVEKLKVDTLKIVKITPKPATLVKHVTPALKLTDRHYARALLADKKGRHYDALKKGWTDGKGHWWYGRFAWVYIDDVWYYGNSRWTFADGDWSCDDTLLAVKPTRSIAIEARSTPASAPPMAKTEPAIETSLAQAASQPIKRPDAASKLPATETPRGQLQPTSAKVTRSELPGIESTALAIPTVATDNPVDAAQTVAPVEAAQTAGPVECKRFLPNLSMTISVPCSQ